MLTHIEFVTLIVYENYGSIKEYGDISVGFHWSNDNNGCYISEIDRVGRKEFGLTTLEINTLKSLAKDLLKSGYYEYQINIRNNTLTKY